MQLVYFLGPSTNHHKKIIEYLLVLIFAFMFLMSTTWIYDMTIFWVLLGLIIKFTEYAQKTAVAIK